MNQDPRTKEINFDLPYIEPNGAIDQSILQMAGTIRMPSQEELDNDPRLSSAFGL